jgi:hypothetical protein
MYDRQGKPITTEEWCRLIVQHDYKVLARTKVGTYVVSTVWLGLDHRFLGRGAPLIFETMVFLASEIEDVAWHGLHGIDGMHHSTEAEARQGHEDMVTVIRATLVENFADVETEERSQ